MPRSILGFTFCLLLAACTQAGPGTISRDRFDYGNAIASSWNEQTLLNILRIRYSEVPIFMEVTSVINQYSVEGELRAGGIYFPNVNAEGDSVNLGATGRWSDRPTITYVPLTGEALMQRLMKPLDPAAVLFLTQGGWPVDFLLPLTVRTANGLQNVSGFQVFRESGQPEFFRLVEILSSLQRSGAVGLRLERKGEEETAVMFLRRKGAPAGELEELRELLDLDPEAGEYSLVYGSLPVNKTEIALLTKSAMEIMAELSTWVDVPPEHVAEGRTRPTRTSGRIGKYRIDPPIRVHHGSKVPATAYVSTCFRGTRFWIDDRDADSKLTFAFLQFMFSLVESGRKQLAPVITVGAGG